MVLDAFHQSVKDPSWADMAVALMLRMILQSQRIDHARQVEAVVALRRHRPELARDLGYAETQDLSAR